MKVLERFINFVKLDSASIYDLSKSPSTPEQLEALKVVAKDMEAAGISKIKLDEHGYLYGLVPATAGYESKAAVGFIAHIDTIPDFSGHGVKPQIIENYDGKDVVLKGSGDVLSSEEFPVLKTMVGQKLITTDGTTLLGADDKAGIAEIITACERIIKEGIPHSQIAVCFTPDEETGSGAYLFDIPNFGAKVAYTVDGAEINEIEYQNFNGASLIVEVTGVAIHPGSSKNRMINSIRVANEYDALLPEFDKPEYTEEFEGFYHLMELDGSVEKTVMKYIIRDHDAEKYQSKIDFAHAIGEFINKKHGRDLVKVTTEHSYRNMCEALKDHMYLVDFAKEAVENLGSTPVASAIRGGTDGARLSYAGLPCPNLGTGGANYHGKFECITEERLELATDLIIEVVKIFAK